MKFAFKKFFSFTLIFALMFSLLTNQQVWAMELSTDTDVEESASLEPVATQREAEAENITEEVNPEKEATVTQVQQPFGANVMMEVERVEVKAERTTYGIGDTIAEVFPDPACASTIANLIAGGDVHTILTQSLADSVMRLDITNPTITNVNGIENFRKLSWLEIHDTQITSLPDGIGNWTNMKIFDVGGNKLTSIPDSIGNMTKIEQLWLYSNQLTSLPESIGAMSSLDQCNFYNNQITQIPESMYQLTNLRYVSFDTNKLTSVSESIGALTKLEWLSLNGNQLTSLPESIGNLVNLKQLDLFTNQLTSLPDSIGNLVNLEKLYVFRNQLTSIPDSIGSLTNLERLYLQDNKLTSVPESIGNLTNLQLLALYINQLTSVPESIGDLTNLQTLYLFNNQLTNIPESIGNLTNLDQLYLYNNQLTSIPTSIVNLPKLTTFYLFNNQLIDVPKALYDKLNAYDIFNQTYTTTLAKGYAGVDYTQQMLPIFTQALTYGDATSIQYKLVKPDHSEDVITPSFVNGKFTIDGSNFTVAGDYQIVVSISGGKLYDSTYTFHLTMEASEPVIALIGDNPQIIKKGSAYEELGCIATDSAFGDITSDVVIDASNVDTTTVGEYTVMYSITNAIGNSATITRTVQVVNNNYTLLKDFDVFSGSGTSMSRVDVVHTDFKTLYINGVEVDPSNYTISSGSTVITLAESYLKTLANGTYSVKSVYENGYADHTLIVAKNSKMDDKENRDGTINAGATNANTELGNTIKTGDNSISIGMLITLFGLSGLIVSQRIRRKRDSL